HREMSGKQGYIGPVKILDERNSNIGGAWVRWTLLADVRAGGVVGVRRRCAYRVQLIVGSSGALMRSAESGQRQHTEVGWNRSGEEIATVQTSLTVGHDMNVPGAELRRFRWDERCQ